MRVHGVSETESPRVALVSVLLLKRGLKIQPAPFSACWSQAPEMEFALLFPPTRFLGDLWLESRSLPWLGLSLS